MYHTWILWVLITSLSLYDCTIAYWWYLIILLGSAPCQKSRRNQNPLLNLEKKKIDTLPAIIMEVENGSLQYLFPFIQGNFHIHDYGRKGKIATEKEDAWKNQTPRRLQVNFYGMILSYRTIFPSEIEWELTNGPLRRLLELLYKYPGLGVRSVGPVGDFLDFCHAVGSPCNLMSERSLSTWWPNQQYHVLPELTC